MTPDLPAQIAAVERALEDYQRFKQFCVGQSEWEIGRLAVGLTAAVATLRAVPALVDVCRKTIATAMEGLRELQDMGLLRSGVRILELERELSAALLPFSTPPDPKEPGR